MLPKKPKYNLAIVGATGAVGTEMIRLIEERNFPVKNIKFLASKKSLGKKLTIFGRETPVEELTEDSFSGIDIALFSAGGTISQKFAPIAVKSGAIVIDNSSAFRMDENVPLIVPEVNPLALKNHKGLIANPNCTTIIMAVAIFPIHRINPIKKITVASYQAVSGAGARALHELREQQTQILKGQKPEAKIFQHVIANNIFSHDSEVLQNGYNKEELKMIAETQKIFGEPIAVNPTCIRVPIERAHSEALCLELSRPVDENLIRNTLSKSYGIKLVDDREKNYFPMPCEASHQNDVLVGRIRKDLTDNHRLNLFVCGDQLLKGAALNALQIAELLIPS